MKAYWLLMLPLVFFWEDYWYIVIPGILLSLIPAKTINQLTKKWIPDEKKRAKFFMSILIGMSVFFTMLLFFVTENIPLGFRLPMCLFPVISVGLGFFLAKIVNRKK